MSQTIGFLPATLMLQCSGSHKCHKYATCTDKCDGYECKCNDGYFGGGNICCDAKQCDTNPCGENTRCVEKCEGYECVCKDNNYRPIAGYAGTGLLNCEHKDKCYGLFQAHLGDAIQRTGAHIQVNTKRPNNNYTK